MIDEKKLIEILSKNSIFEKITNAEGKNIFEIIDDMPKTDCSECSRRKFYQQGYQDGLNADKWIPCSDGNVKRLPSKKGFYQVTCEWEGKLEVYDLWYGDDGWMLDEDEGEVLQKVIAWQPLPQPYKKEGADDE